MGEKLERKCDIPKKVPLFGSRRLKMGEKLERKCDIPKKVPLQRIRQDFRELLFAY